MNQQWAHPNLFSQQNLKLIWATTVNKKSGSWCGFDFMDLCQNFRTRFSITTTTTLNHCFALSLSLSIAFSLYFFSHYGFWLTITLRPNYKKNYSTFLWTYIANPIHAMPTLFDILLMIREPWNVSSHHFFCCFFCFPDLFFFCFICQITQHFCFHMSHVLTYWRTLTPI